MVFSKQSEDMCRLCFGMFCLLQTILVWATIFRVSFEISIEIKVFLHFDKLIELNNFVRERKRHKLLIRFILGWIWEHFRSMRGDCYFHNFVSIRDEEGVARFLIARKGKKYWMGGRPFSRYVTMSIGNSNRRWSCHSYFNFFFLSQWNWNIAFATMIALFQGHSSLQ